MPRDLPVTQIYGYLMSALETEFFNLLETSESRWTTLFIEGRTWTNFAVQSLAWQAQISRLKAGGSRFATFQRSGPDERKDSTSAPDATPEEHEETWRIWAAPGTRRALFQVGQDLVDVVIEGSTFWSNGHGRSITNGGKSNHSHGQGDGQNLIRTEEYTDLLQAVELSGGLRSGRRTIEAIVTTREREHPERGPGLHGLTIGDPDVLELSVDRERGVVLRASSQFHGAPYRIVEATDVVFDPAFGVDTFDIQPRFGAEWVST
jgi:hypothetical protein